MLFNFASEYAIRRVQVKRDGLKLSVTRQLLAHADVSILGGSLHSVKTNTEAVVIARRETGLKVNAVKPKCMVMSRD